MRKLVLSFLATGFLLAGAACGQQELSRDSVESLGVVQLGDLKAATAQTIRDTTLYRAVDFVVDGGRAFVAESVPGRIAVLGPDLRLEARIGRPGEGPGELKSPWTIQIRNGELSTSEFGNGRISVFDTAGSFKHVVRHPGQAIHLPLPGGEHLAYTSDPSHRGIIVSNAAPPKPWGGPVPKADRFGGPVPIGRPMMVRPQGAEMVALTYGQSGTLVVLDLAGTEQRSFPLPSEILAELEARENPEFIAGRKVLSTHIIKGVGRSADGRFVTVALSSRLAPFLIYDLRDEIIYRLDATGHPFEDQARNATDGYIEGDRFYILHQDDLYAFHIDLPR